MSTNPASAKLGCVDKTVSELDRRGCLQPEYYDEGPDPILIINDRGIILSASDAVHRVFGWSPQELIGQNIKVLMPAPFREAHDDYLVRYKRTGQTKIIDRTREFEARHRDGSVFPIDLTVSRFSPPEGAPLFIGHIRDTTQRKQSERTTRLILDLTKGLCELPTLREALVETIRVICQATGWSYGEAWVRSARGGELFEDGYWMDTASPIPGLHEAVSHPARHRFGSLPPEVWGAEEAMWFNDLNKLQDPFLRECLIQAGSKSVSAVVVPVRWSARTIAAILFLQDSTAPPSHELMKMVRLAMMPLGGILQHRLDAEELRRTQEWIDLAMRASSASAWEWWISDNRIDNWSPTHTDLFGLEFLTPPSLEELLDHVHPEDREGLEASFRHAIHGKQTEWTHEFRFIHPVQGERWVLGFGLVLRDDDRHPLRMVGISFDITQRKLVELELERHRHRLEELVSERTAELKRTHEQLRVTDRLAAVGTLAAGLGHDMGNMLLPIQANLNAMRAMCPKQEQQMGYLGEIERSINYLQRLSDGLHHLSMDPVDFTAPEPTRLQEWWQSAGVILTKSLAPFIDLKVDIPDSLPPVTVPPHLVTQALLNLLVNSGEALADMGQQERQPAVHVQATYESDAERICLIVEDNGPGMSEETRQRAFDMFYTTKPAGKGTGLGLALVHNIMTQSNGEVQLESHLGVGTRVTLRMPAVVPPPDEQRRQELRAEVALSDGRLRSLVEMLLTGNGVEIACGADKRVDILLVDPSHAELLEIAGQAEVIVFSDSATTDMIGLSTRKGSTIMSQTTDLSDVQNAIMLAIQTARGHDDSGRSAKR